MVRTDNSSENFLSSNLNQPPIDNKDPIVEKSDVQDIESEPNALPVGIKDRNTGLGATVESASQHMASGQPTTGGDPDAMNEQAKVVGEEAIGGSTPTPDQNNIDDIADATGINITPEEPVEVINEMRQRDNDRFELDPDIERR